MRWKCEICGKEFENFLAYVLHMEWHEEQAKKKALAGFSLGVVAHGSS